MRPVSERFLDALRGPHAVVSAVDLYFPGAVSPVSVPVEAGTVTLDRTAVVRRSGQVRIPWALEAGVDLGVDLRTLPFGGYARLSRGIRFPDGTAELVALGHFRIESVAWDTTEASAALELADRMAQVRDEPFTAPYSPQRPDEELVSVFGNLTDGSPVVSGITPNTAALNVGQDVYGMGIPAGTRILSIDSASQITLTQAARLYAYKTVAGSPGSVVLSQIGGTDNLAPGMQVTIGPNVYGQEILKPATFIDSVRSDSEVWLTKFTNDVAFWGPDSASGFANATFTVDGAGVELQTGGGKRIADAAIDLVFAVFGDAIEYRKPHDPAIVLRDVFFNENRSAALFGLAKAAAGEAYFDATGAFVFGPPTGTGTPVWDIDAGASGVMVAANEALDRTDVFNGVLVTGQERATNAPVSALVVDDDPASFTRWGGPFGKVARVEDSSAVSTPEQAAAAASALLNRRLGLQRSLTLTAAPNPALEPGDVVTVRFPDGRTEAHALDVVRLSLGPVESQELATRTTFAGAARDATRGRRVHPFTMGRRVFTGPRAFAELGA